MKNNIERVRSILERNFEPVKSAEDQRNFLFALATYLDYTLSQRLLNGAEDYHEQNFDLEIEGGFSEVKIKLLPVWAFVKSVVEERKQVQGSALKTINTTTDISEMKKALINSIPHLKKLGKNLDLLSQEHVNSNYKYRRYAILYHEHLLSYLEELSKKELKESQPSESIGIKGLFLLSESPKTKVFYKGSNKEVPKRWITTAGKTQPFAILKLAAEKHRRKTKTKVMLSLTEIEKCLRDKKTCSRTPDWEANYTQKRRLELLKKNILDNVKFTDSELTVEKSGETAHLVFYPPK